MKKYAIIQIAGKQYRVAEGDMVTIDRLPQAPDEKIVVTDVLMTGNGDQISIGSPLVSKASVTLKVTGQSRGDKIRVATYKAKSRYRKVRGHRQSLSTVEVVSITA
ncbi:MAG TPA: 50S ribosomal protein L21 [Vitreimonas sp.]|nr:50S ribosomal protein L21 [Vitreimonas sp.]